MTDLVWVRIGDVEKAVGREFADANNLDILDEDARRSDGSARRTTRVGGRPRKPRTSVAQAAANKQAANPDASTPEEASE